MISKSILIVTCTISLMMSLIILRKTNGRSLLVWHVLVFISIQPFLLFVRYLMNVNTLSVFAPFDEVVVDRMVDSFIFSDIISIAYMFLFIRFIKKKSADTSEDLRYEDMNNNMLSYWIGIAISFLGLLWYINSAKGQLILSYGLSSLGDYNDYYKLRYEYGLQRGSVFEQYFYVISVLILVPIITLYSLQNFLRKYDKKWLVLWLLNLSVWVFASLLAYAKSPIIAAVMSNFLLLIFSLQNKHINRVYWVIIGMAGTAVCVYAMYLVTSIAYGSNDISDVLGTILDRFVIVPMATAYNHFYIFPDVGQHTYYSNSRSLNIILGGGNYVNTGGLQTFEIASYHLFGIAFNMNTGFVAAGWAELGYIGVIQVSVIVFGLLSFWDIQFYRMNRHIAIDVLLIFFIGRLWQINNGDMMFLLIPGGFVFAPLIYLFLTRRTVRLSAPSKAVKLVDSTEIMVN